MKVRQRLLHPGLSGLLIIVLVAIIGACSMTATVSINDRLNTFISDMNSNKSNVWTNFHDNCLMKDQLKNYTLSLQPRFGNETNYALSSVSIAGSVVTAQISYTGISNATISFTMQTQEKDVWYIRTMTYGGFTYQ